MNSGFFINDELLTLVTTKQPGKLQFNGFNKDIEVPLFFLFNKDQDPPIELNEEAKSLYYPGNPDVLGDILRFTDKKNDSLKIYGKEFNSIEILNKLMLKLLSDHHDLLPENENGSVSSNFLLVVPPYISKDLRNNLINSIPEELKPVQVINYSIPYIHSLLAEDKLPEKGNVLYVEISYSDIFFQLLSTSIVKDKPAIKVKKEDRISDTKLIFRTIQMIAEEIIELAFHKYGFASNNENLNTENEIQHLIPYAQDIFAELNTIEDWNSIEFDIELSDGTNGSVVLLKNKLQKKFAAILESEGLESKINQFLKKHKPANIVLVGENSNNWFLLDYFNSCQECKKIKHQEDYYQQVCHTVFDSIESVEKEAIPENETMELIVQEDTQVEVVEQQIIPAQIHKSDPPPRNKKAKKGKSLLLKILIPVLILIVAFLAYKYGAIISYKVNPKNIEFSSKAGEIQLLKISSFGEWQISEIPEWLKMEKVTSSGTEEILVWTADENKTNSTKKANIKVMFGNNISKSVEIIQLGEDEGIGKTSTENDTVSSFNESIETGNWSFNDLNSYIEGIRGSSDNIDFNSLFNDIDPNCEVYYYINGEKISSEDVTTFLNKIKFGGSEKLVPNSLKYNSQGKLIEFGQE